jgi:hypothetical protein
MYGYNDSTVLVLYTKVKQSNSERRRAERQKKKTSEGN